MKRSAKSGNRPPRASRTAEFAAWFRALEVAYPKERRLVEDPFAAKLISAPLRIAAIGSRCPLIGRAIPALVDRLGPGARLSGVARTRLIDDHLVHALDCGIRQVVILGSGFDCRPYRVPEIKKARVFEVDLPRTLAVKREKLSRLIHPMPDGVFFVETDLNVEKLEPALAESGFDRESPAFFIWEGVTQYLSERAVDQTLRYVGSSAPGSFLFFTYVHQRGIEQLKTDKETRRIHRLLKRVGEPWRFGMVPEKLHPYLEERGLSLVEDVHSIAYRRKYLNPAGKHLAGYEFYRAALAEVKQPEKGPAIRYFRARFK